MKQSTNWSSFRLPSVDHLSRLPSVNVKLKKVNRMSEIVRIHCRSYIVKALRVCTCQKFIIRIRVYMSEIHSSDSLLRLTPTSASWRHFRVSTVHRSAHIFLQLGECHATQPRTIFRSLFLTDYAFSGWLLQHFDPASGIPNDYALFWMRTTYTRAQCTCLRKPCTRQQTARERFVFFILLPHAAGEHERKNTMQYQSKVTPKQMVHVFHSD